MITQQTASYLIKKMTEAVEKPNHVSSEDTDKLFRAYVQNKDNHNAVNALRNGTVSDEAIVQAFQWRVAALVCVLSCFNLLHSSDT
jgi:acyl-CoA oxidase